MAITGFNGTAGSDTTNDSSDTTNTFALNSSELYLVALCNTKGSTPEKATPSCSTTQTFVELGDVLFNTIAAPVKRLTLWYFIGSATVAGQTVTFDYGGINQTGAIWAIRRYNGSIGLVTVRGTGVTNRADTASGTGVTLPALADANSMAFGVFAAPQAGSVVYTAGSGFTLRQDPTGMTTPSVRIVNEEQIGTDNTVDITSDGISTGIAAIACELIESGAAAGQPTTKRYAGQPFAGVRSPQFHRGIWRY